MPKWLKKYELLRRMEFTLYALFGVENILFFFFLLDFNNYKIDNSIIVYFISMVIGIILFYTGIKKIFRFKAEIENIKISSILYLQCDPERFIKQVEPAVTYIGNGRLTWYSQTASELSLKTSLATAYMLNGDCEKAIALFKDVYLHSEYNKNSNGMLYYLHNLIIAYITNNDVKNAKKYLFDYEQALKDTNSSKNDLQFFIDSLAEMKYRLNLICGNTAEAAEYYEDLLNSEPNMLITYRTTIYWLLANIYRIEGREEQEIDCLKKADELGYNLFTAQKARQILKDKGITVKNMPIAPVELPKVKYIKPLLCIATACLPCIWFIITHF